MMRDQGIPLGDLEAWAAELRGEGATARFAAVDGGPGGVIAVADPIKASTPEALWTLWGTASTLSC
jgi:P-type Cu+ transporter